MADRYNATGTPGTALFASGHLVLSDNSVSLDMDTLAEKIRQKFGPDRERAFRDACVVLEVAGEDYIRKAPEELKAVLEVFLRSLIRDLHIHVDTEKKIMEAK
jgi:hypothetical protein